MVGGNLLNCTSEGETCQVEVVPSFYVRAVYTEKKKVKRGENGRVCFVHLFHVGAVYTE